MLKIEDCPTLKVRLFKKIKKTKTCWLFTGHRDKNGYGKISFYPGKSSLAHRASFLIANSTMREDLVVCHKCDNPSCVNPDHLFLGTQLENMRDMIQKGRDRKKQKPKYCKNGHEFKIENTYIRVHRASGGRACKTCNAIRTKKYYQIKKDKKHGACKNIPE